MFVLTGNYYKQPRPELPASACRWPARGGRRDIRNCFGKLNDPGKPALRRLGILPQHKNVLASGKLRKGGRDYGKLLKLSLNSCGYESRPTCEA